MTTTTMMMILQFPLLFASMTPRLISSYYDQHFFYQQDDFITVPTTYPHCGVTGIVDNHDCVDNRAASSCLRINCLNTKLFVSVAIQTPLFRWWEGT